jgi:hypothetical protein
MGRGRAFSPIEEGLLKQNYDKTIAELEEILAKHGYIRSRKSINRKLEKLRENGDVGFRSRDTIKRSYRQRTRRNKKLQPTEIVASNRGGWDSGDGSFDSGEGSFDNGVSWDDTE